MRDASKVYEQMGLIAAGDPFPFIGSVAYLAGTKTDSTLLVVTLSIPSRAVTFQREGDRDKGQYQVRLDLRQGSTLVRHVENEPEALMYYYKPLGSPNVITADDRAYVCRGFRCAE